MGAADALGRAPVGVADLLGEHGKARIGGEAMVARGLCQQLLGEADQLGERLRQRPHAAAPWSRAKRARSSWTSSTSAAVTCIQRSSRAASAAPLCASAPARAVDIMATL